MTVKSSHVDVWNLAGELPFHGLPAMLALTYSTRASGLTCLRVRDCQQLMIDK